MGAVFPGEAERSEVEMAEISAWSRMRMLESLDVEEPSRGESWPAVVSVPGVTIDGWACLGDVDPVIQRY